MKHRKSHKKSRLGCSQCKQRRVKCDEQTPVCGNCEKRGRDCSLGQPRPSTEPSDRPEKGLSLLHLDPRTTGDDWSLPTVELTLMHHFSVYTHRSFVQHPDDAEAAQLKLPLWGLSNPHLLDAIFSITALHLAYLNAHPDDFQKYGQLAVRYQDRARAKLQSSLINPSPEDCPMLFMSSSLIALSAFVVPKIYAKTTSLVSTLCYLSRLFRGSGALETVSKQLVGEEAWALQFPTRKVEPIQGDTPIRPEVRQVLDAVRAVIISPDSPAVPNEDKMETDQPPSPQAAYLEGLDSLQSAFQTINCRMSNVLSWPVKAGTDFITLLEAADPVSMLVTLCYGMLLRTLDDIWWAEGWGKQLVEEISPSLMEGHPKWADIIGLVRKDVGLHDTPPADPPELDA